MVQTANRAATDAMQKLTKESIDDAVQPSGRRLIQLIHPQTSEIGPSKYVTIAIRANETVLMMSRLIALTVYSPESRRFRVRERYLRWGGFAKR